MRNTLLNALIALTLFLLLVVGSVGAVTWTSTGGCYTAIDGAYTLQMWNTTTATSWKAPTGVTSVDLLVVAGGGGAGGTQTVYGGGNWYGGSGGGGGWLNQSSRVVSSSTTYTLTVGAGGTKGTSSASPTTGSNGGNSVFDNITALGGGGGGRGLYWGAGLAGGSGGGAGGTYTGYHAESGLGGNGQQTNSGGATGFGYGGGNGYTVQYSGGGGGAGGNGTSGSAGGSGTGGVGRYSTISGTNLSYAAGGTIYANSQGVDGTGNGGNTGTGNNGGYDGGDGVIILKYLSQVNASFTVTPYVPYGGVVVQFNDTSTNSPTLWNWSFRNVTGNNTQVWFSTTRNASQKFGVGNYSIVLNASTSLVSNISTQTTWVNLSQAVSNPNYEWTSDGYTVLVWNTTTTSGVFAAPYNVSTIDYLVVGGGGGGGYGAAGYGAGGGGAGAYHNGSSFSISYGFATIAVGAAGTGGVALDGTNGGTSWFNSSGTVVTSTGGGAGSNTAGASGGGGRNNALTPYPGNDGNNGGVSNNNPPVWAGGGGGGAGSVGADGTNYGGNGGSGKLTNITGSPKYYAGGGGAGVNNPKTYLANIGIGGSGVGGNGSYTTLPAQAGLTGTGSGGGGGGSSGNGGAGGSGVVIIRYANASAAIAPVASFTPLGEVTGIVPLTVQFNDTTTNNPSSWNWSFGDASFSVVQNASHAFGLGNFSVSLTATNSGGSNTSTQVTWVNTSLGTVSFTPSATQTGYSPLSVAFNGSTTMDTPTGWSWAYTGFGTNTSTGIFGTTQNATGIFRTTGTDLYGNFTVNLTVTNAYGTVVSTQTTWVNVTSHVPVASFTPLGEILGSVHGYNQYAVTFNDTSSNTPTAWNWSYRNVTGNNITTWFSTHTNITRIFRPGNYSIALNASNSIGFNLSSQTTFVNITLVPPEPPNATYACGYNNLYTCVDFVNATNNSAFNVSTHVGEVTYLIVGGGGSGGQSLPAGSYGNGNGGGGGGGGVLYCASYTLPLGVTVIPVTVGGSDESSSFNSITAFEGGRGGLGVDHKPTRTGGTGGDGGSGGGGGTTSGYNGNGTLGQGYAGVSAQQYWAGNGGGAGGTDGSPLAFDASQFNFWNSTVTAYLAGGGGGGSGVATPGISSPTTGGGGGGSTGGGTPDPGKKGEVIVRYLTPSVCGASFEPTGNTSIFSGDTVSFIDHSWSVPDHPVSWSWSYQASGTNTTSAIFSTQQNPTAFFTEGIPGTYSSSTFNISLTVVDSNGTTHQSCQNTSIKVYAIVNHQAYTITSDNCTAYVYDIQNQSVNLPYKFVVPDYVGFVKYLVVGGGGEGGLSWQPEYQTPGYGGGGGAGGYLSNDFFLPNKFDIFTINVGGAAQNSSVTSNAYPPIIAYRGGAGGQGFPDTQQPGGVGEWGGSGGGGGSGGAGSPWGCTAAGGLGTPGQGKNGGCSYGGYALTTGGGGGGAAGVGASGQYGSAGGAGKWNNITFTNTTYSEGGYGEQIQGGSYPCLDTFGSGGRADYSPYVGSCRTGQNGTVVFQVCPYSPRTIITPLPIDIQDEPKLVLFRVQTQTGEVLVNARVSIQGITTTTGIWDWLSTLLSIPLDEAPIHNTLMIGTTDSLGSIEFMMLPTVKYNVTTTTEGYTFPALYLYPHDEEYLITANHNSPDYGWVTPEPVWSGERTMTVSTAKITPVLGQVTVVYDDTGFTTTGGFINITNKGSLLHSIPAANSVNETKDIVLDQQGTSIIVSARINTTGGMYIKDYTAEYAGSPVVIPGGFGTEVVMLMAIVFIVLTSLLAEYSQGRHVAIIVCAEAWIFYSAGWFQPLVDRIGTVGVIGLFSLATLIVIIWNIREGLLEEVGGL